MVRRLVIVIAAILGVASPVFAGGMQWDAVVGRAQGQTVYWHAWGGEPRINDYIAWVGRTVKARYGVDVRHVKVTDTANVVSKILAEKTAGRQTSGSVDLVWINGENFAAMKKAGLLQAEPWATHLPAYVHVDRTKGVERDFTIPTDGLEAPWGMAQLVFYRDSERLAEPPRSISALLDWARDHPGRFTYPRPPDFIGTTFLKQALLELTGDPEVLLRPAEKADVASTIAPLFGFLDALHPVAWREGRTFPQSIAVMRRLLNDGEIDIGFAFNPADASNAIANGELPETVRSFVMKGGTIGNTHYVSIPFNASAREGALVLANFLMSPEAQARKADPSVWGDPTVLDVEALEPADRRLFDKLDLGVATLPPQERGRALSEPHPSWTRVIEVEWEKRYGAGQ